MDCITIINNSQNTGLSKSFQIGINRALKTNSDYIVIVDADNQYDTSSISSIIPLMVETIPKTLSMDGVVMT